VVGRCGIADLETAASQYPPDDQSRVGPVARFYARPHKPLHGALASTERFRAAVQEAKVGTDKDIPHITAPTIIKHTSSLQLLGLL
jgi:fatty acid CoA ligase FadD9